MAYEEGTYLRELEEEHRNGRHEHRLDWNCPPCRVIEDEMTAKEAGFDSIDAYHQWMSDQANQYNPDLEAAIDEVVADIHQSGGHRKYPSYRCHLCVEKHGEDLSLMWQN